MLGLKEMPFCPSEIEEIARPWVRICAKTPVMSFSHLAAQNVLWMQIAHPWVARLVHWPYLWLVRLYERRWIRRRLKTNNWVLILCEGVST
jgi:hypothetical protein